MLVERKEYLNKLIAFRDKQIIKVVTGIRRCGKSTLLEMYQDYLRKQGILPEQIISINFEDYDYEELTDGAKLYAYIKDWQKTKQHISSLMKFTMLTIFREW